MSTLTGQQLMERVSRLTDADCRFALSWLATFGSDEAEGQALLRALAAIELRDNKRLNGN